jgi:cleavage and polyadenylation specificity factor subunit 3
LSLPTKNKNKSITKNNKTEDNDSDDDASMNISDEDEDNDEEEEIQRLLRERTQAELNRLHRIGIPVPGLAIKVDKMEATVWLENLEVECKNKVFADRVRAVVEGAVEVTAPLWG